MKIYTAGKIEIAYVPWDNWEFRNVEKYKINDLIDKRLKEMGGFRLPDANEINYICRELHEKLRVGGFYKGLYWYGLYKEMEEERESLRKEYGTDNFYIPPMFSTYWLDDTGRNFDRYEDEDMTDVMTKASIVAVRDI